MMFARVLSIVAMGLLATGSGANAMPPWNDDCPEIYFPGDNLVQGVAFEGDTTFATTNGSASCRPTNSGKDVWHTFVPRCTGVYRIETCGSGFDVVLSVHSDCPGTTANTIACLDDGSLGGATSCPITLHPAMHVFLERNTRYFIRVAGYSSGGTPASGPYRLLITPTSPTPPNNTCAFATPVTDGEWPFSNCAATTEFSATNACIPPDFGHYDLWYRYTASCDGLVSIDTCSSDFDTVLMIYPGNPCPSADTRLIECNDDIGMECGFGGLGSKIFLTVASGEEYLVRLTGLTPDNAGSGVLSINCYPILSCPQCPADYNEDGGVDGTDVDAFFADWEQGLPCSDVSGDGGVDGSDVAFFFIFWENGGCE